MEHIEMFIHVVVVQLLQVCSSNHVCCEFAFDTIKINLVSVHLY